MQLNENVERLHTLAKSLDAAVDRALSASARIVVSLTWERGAGQEGLVPTLRVDIAPRT